MNELNFNSCKKLFPKFEKTVTKIKQIEIGSIRAKKTMKLLDK